MPGDRSNIEILGQCIGTHDGGDYGDGYDQFYDVELNEKGYKVFPKAPTRIDSLAIWLISGKAEAYDAGGNTITLEPQWKELFNV